MSSEPASLLCIGPATVDLGTRLEGPPPDDARILATDGALAGGGPAATAAVALARLGVPVAFLGTVGRDRAGDLVVQGLLDEGVDISLLRRVAGPTAISAIWVARRPAHGGSLPTTSLPAGATLPLANLVLPA